MLSRLDQPIRLTESDVTLFDDVDEIIERSITIGDPLVAFEFGNHLRRKQAVEGVALAKLLSKLYQSWDLFVTAGTEDTFENVVQAQMGVAHETTKKYVRMWNSIFENEDIEDETKKLLMGRGVGDLLLLTAAVREGDLQGEDLIEAAVAPDQATLRDIIRHKRGDYTSSSTAIRFMVSMKDTAHMREGTIYVKRGDEYATIGYLEKPISELQERAIAKLISMLHATEVF